MDSPATTSSIFNLECPISIKWTISEEKLLALKDTKYKDVETEHFNASNISGVKYFLQIFLGWRDYVCIYLNVSKDKKEKFKIDVNYTVESAHYTRNEKRDYGLCGFEMCKTADLFNSQKKFIVNGKFTFKCEGLLYFQREKQPARIENVIKFDTGLGHKLWMDDDDKDVTINVNGSCVKAHKCILAVQSPYFKAMFQSGKKESMDIKDFAVKVVETAVQFCYLGETSAVLDLKDKMGLIEFFDKYEMSDLKTRIEASLILDVSVSNVCLLANCSIRSNAVKLEEACFKLLFKPLKNGTTPVADIGLLDKDFAFKVFTDAFCIITETS